ncbi:MAG TPA: glycosyltransferase family A protein [Acidimicrobiales bacterium]|jgi:glycosyltransferase involved in cell wall biosynthesis
MTPPRLSVVVPTYNRAAQMVRLLEALDAQLVGERFEVIVVDDASTDDTVKRLEADRQRHPYHLVVLGSDGNGGPARARNRGWNFARGDVIAFVDDDCVPTPNWLGSLSSGLDEADVAIGQTRPPESQLADIGPFSALLDIGHNYSYSTCNIAYRRSVLEQTGGFDAFVFSHVNGEDTDLGLRAMALGARETYVPDALVLHDVAPSDWRAHRRRMRRMAGLPALVARHPVARRHLDAGWFIRSQDKAVLVGWAALACLAVRPRSGPVRLAVLGAAGLYAWQFNRSHYPARSRAEWVRALGPGFLTDSYGLVVLARGSLRHRTMLL